MLTLDTGPSAGDAVSDSASGVRVAKKSSRSSEAGETLPSFARLDGRGRPSPHEQEQQPPACAEVNADCWRLLESRHSRAGMPSAQWYSHAALAVYASRCRPIH